MEDIIVNVNVAVRVRPLLSEDDNNVVKYIHEEGEPPVLMVSDKRNIYAFDHVFSSEIHQCEVYNVTVKPLVSKVLNGYNCTILAYGQTGTGKTYTMGTDSEKYHNTDSGLIPRVLDDFFDIANRDPDISICISFIEIYNEKVYDLLQNSKTSLVVKGFNVHGMTCITVGRNEEAQHWLLFGGKNRHVRHTKLNASSSRSHAIFTVYCAKKSSGVMSKLHLVDLAGSESVRRTGNQGQAFQEGVTINRGLLAVGRVISALSDKHTSVIPYRDSTLTTILHDSLSVNNYVSLLACISPSDTDISETLATLRFAVKAKSVKSRPQLENIVSEYDRANPGLLGDIEPLSTTIKKKRKLPPMVTSTQVKKSLFKNTNASIQSVDTRNDRFTSSPNFASTLDSLSISSSTTIDCPKQQFALSPLVQRCTEVLQNTVREQVNNIIQEKICKTPALFKQNEDKENSPPLIVHWPTVESRMTEIIRKELAELTGNGSMVNRTRKISTPRMQKQLDFESPLGNALQHSPASPITNMDDQLFKMPIPIHRAVKRLKETTRSSVSTATSPIIPVRRSTRLSIKMCEDIAPTPAPRFKIPESVKRIKTPNFSSPLRPTRKSVRLSMKCISRAQYSPKPVLTPAPRVRKTLLQTRLPFTKSTNSNFEEMKKWKTPKKIESSPHKIHKFRILRLLNVGTQKELQSLVTIGIKTALQILTYRNLNGEFKKFEDLTKIPTWGEKKYEKFILGNQLM